MRIRVRLIQSVVLVAAMAAVGCADTAKKPTVKAEAKKQWDGARAGVLFSLAKDQYQSGNFDRCRETLNEATRLAPENVHVLLAHLRAATFELPFAQGYRPSEFVACGESSAYESDAAGAPHKAESLGRRILRWFERPKKDAKGSSDEQ